MTNLSTSYFEGMDTRKLHYFNKHINESRKLSVLTEIFDVSSDLCVTYKMRVSLSPLGANSALSACFYS